MKQEIRDLMRSEIALFAEKLRAFDNGELEAKSYKGFSGGFGSYAQRSGGNMLRLRMAGGRLTPARLGFIADCAEAYGINRMKITTGQTIQLHNLPSDVTVAMMEKAIDVDIITRGGGGDFLRNVMASPLSGVEQGEYFDVLPIAEAAAEYMLGIVRNIKMPRKLKVCFSNSPSNVTHATFRDLGFAARQDGTFDVYCAGGLGPNPKLGVQVAEAVAPTDVPACIDAMISVFTTFGNYENRAKARTRYLQDTLGADGLKAEYTKALTAALAASPKLTFSPVTVEKTGNGSITHERVIPQKQNGLYAVCYHPRGGNLPPAMPRKLYDAISGMSQVECRLSPDGCMYIINLTAAEAEAVLAITADSAVSPFHRSVSCIGGTICSTGVRDSQGLLAAMMEAVDNAELPANALPTVHVSGCPSSCGTQQIGTLGFQGASKMVNGKPQPAFALLMKGCEKQGQEKLGENLGTILQDEIPGFMVELGKTVAASGLGFDQWLAGNEDAFRALAAKYISK